MKEKVIIELISAIMINVTSGFLAVILISPGIFGVSSFNEYLRIFSTNLPFTAFGFFVSYKLLLKKEKYEL